jgi:hypothetical protein
LSIMHWLAGEAANPRLKHRAAQLVSMSETPHSTQTKAPPGGGASWVFHACSIGLAVSPGGRKGRHPADAATWAANGFDRLHVEVEARQQAADEAARLEGPLSSAEVSCPRLVEGPAAIDGNAAEATEGLFKSPTQIEPVRGTLPGLAHFGPSVAPLSHTRPARTSPSAQLTLSVQ